MSARIRRIRARVEEGLHLVASDRVIDVTRVFACQESARIDPVGIRLLRCRGVHVRY